MSTMKDFSSLNSLIKDTAVSANLRAIQDACSLADQALSTAQQIASEYARLYTQVQWLTYDSNGNIQDETPVEQQKVANSVIAAARQRLRTILERLNALPNIESTSTQEIKISSNNQLPLTQWISTETRESVAGQAGSVITGLVAYEGLLCLLIVPTKPVSVANRVFIGADTTANKCVLYDIMHGRLKTCTGRNNPGSSGVSVVIDAPTGTWVNGKSLDGAILTTSWNPTGTHNLTSGLNSLAGLEGITGSVKWNVMTAVKNALPSVQSIIDALPSI